MHSTEPARARVALGVMGLAGSWSISSCRWDPVSSSVKCRSVLVTYCRITKHCQNFSSELLWIGNWTQLSWVVPVQGLSSGCSQYVIRAGITWRLDWGWRIHFQDGALTGPLAGGLGSSPHEPSIRQLKCSHGMATWFPSELVLRKGGTGRGREGEGSYVSFITESLRWRIMTLFAFCQSQRPILGC